MVTTYDDATAILIFLGVGGVTILLFGCFALAYLKEVEAGYALIVGGSIVISAIFIGAGIHRLVNHCREEE